MVARSKLGVIFGGVHLLYDAGGAVAGAGMVAQAPFLPRSTVRRRGWHGGVPDQVADRAGESKQLGIEIVINKATDRSSNLGGVHVGGWVTWLSVCAGLKGVRGGDRKCPSLFPLLLFGDRLIVAGDVVSAGALERLGASLDVSG